MVAIASGLQEGEPVVSDGSLFLQFANSHPIEANSMIARLVSFALPQRFLIVIASLALMVWGAISFQNLPIDAYPDLSPPHVEIITQWPGHAAEEVERLVTIPHRNRDERDSAAGSAALDFAVWTFLHRR